MPEEGLENRDLVWSYEDQSVRTRGEGTISWMPQSEQEARERLLWWGQSRERTILSSGMGIYETLRNSSPLTDLSCYQARESINNGTLSLDEALKKHGITDSEFLEYLYKNQ